PAPVWGDNSWGQAAAPAGSGQFTAIAAGASHSLAWSAGDTIPPSISVLSPQPDSAVPVGFALDFTASDESSGPVTLAASLSDGSSSLAVASGDLVSKAGVYILTVTAADQAGNTSTAVRQFVAYDPAAGFVNGQGWLQPNGAPAQARKGRVLPEGATTQMVGGLPGADDASRADFSITAEYKRAAGMTTGQLEFRYQNGGLQLSSTTLDWLVVADASRAQLQGKATIAGLAGEFPFRVEVRDGNAGKPKEPDNFVLRVWAAGANPWLDAPVYNVAGDLRGGNIAVHQK
ncbi:MAG: hypothetical protein ACYC4L_07395, partial [Chloroflexota bacterium]